MSKRMKYKPVPAVRMAPSPREVSRVFVSIFRVEIEKAIKEERFPGATIQHPQLKENHD